MFWRFGEEAQGTAGCRFLRPLLRNQSDFKGHGESPFPSGRQRREQNPQSHSQSPTITITPTTHSTNPTPQPKTETSSPSENGTTPSSSRHPKKPIKKRSKNGWNRCRSIYRARTGSWRMISWDSWWRDGRGIVILRGIFVSFEFLQSFWVMEGFGFGYSVGNGCVILSWL